MKANLVTHTFIKCPNCGEGEHRVDHLFGSWTNAGPWYCDECGRGFRLTIDAQHQVDVEMIDVFHIRTLDLLVMPPQDRPVYFVVEGFRDASDERSAEKQHESNQFLYEEHSCPTNHVRCEAIISEGDDDPHGIFQYVRSTDKKEGQEYDGAWGQVFPEAFVEGPIVDGEVNKKDDSPPALVEGDKQ